MRKVRSMFLLLKSYQEQIQIAKSIKDQERSVRMVITRNKDLIGSPVLQESLVSQHSRKKVRK